MSMYYILEDKKTKAVSSEEWGRWFRTADTRVAVLRDGDILVSTVFLGLNASSESAPPQIFETMVFGGPLDKEQEKCSTWKQAEEMHRRMAQRVVEAVQAQREVVK